MVQDFAFLTFLTFHPYNFIKKIVEKKSVYTIKIYRIRNKGNIENHYMILIVSLKEPFKLYRTV